MLYKTLIEEANKKFVESYSELFYNYNRHMIKCDKVGSKYYRVDTPKKELDVTLIDNTTGIFRLETPNSPFDSNLYEAEDYVIRLQFTLDQLHAFVSGSSVESVALILDNAFTSVYLKVGAYRAQPRYYGTAVLTWVRPGMQPNIVFTEMENPNHFELRLYGSVANMNKPKKEG